jgi:hypothetical protein
MSIRPQRIPQPSLNPRALAICTRLKKHLRLCVKGLFCSFVSAVVLGPFAIFPFLICGAVYLLLYATRLAVIALCFTRYSLAHMLFVTLSSSVCVSLLMTVPREWKIIPGLGLLTVVLLVHAYIQVQDPEGDNFTPPFIRETVRARRRRQRVAR